MHNSKYLILPNSPKTVPGVLEEKHRIEAKIKSIVPCMTSPNITPNKNGKLTQANNAGLISLY